MATSRMGRPTIPYKTSWGENILGLKRTADGRWRVFIGGREIKFIASEQDAVARFRASTAQEVVNVPAWSTATVHNGRMYLNTLEHFAFVSGAIANIEVS